MIFVSLIFTNKTYYKNIFTNVISDWWLWLSFQLQLFFLYYYREVILQRFECFFRMFLTHLAAFCLMEDSTREASARSKSATVCLCPWRSLPWGISGSLIYNFVCVLGRIFNFVLPDISINQQFIAQNLRNI